MLIKFYWAIVFSTGGRLRESHLVRVTDARWKKRKREIRPRAPPSSSQAAREWTTSANLTASIVEKTCDGVCPLSQLWRRRRRRIRSVPTSWLFLLLWLYPLFPLYTSLPIVTVLESAQRFGRVFYPIERVHHFFFLFFSSFYQFYFYIRSMSLFAATRSVASRSYNRRERERQRWIRRWMGKFL